MGKLGLFLILALAPPLSASDLVNATHFFPVVSRTDGLAGTRWLTALRITNPHDTAIVVTARLSAGGGYTSVDLTLPAGATLGWSDLAGDLFGFEGNGALLLEASADANPGLPAVCRTFAASMRIATAAAGGGSYGQGVPALDPLTGFLGDWIAVFPSVSLWGVPGGSGFRSNVGFWNLGAGDAQLRLRILDSAGAEAWRQVVTVRRHEPSVVALPRGLDLETASLLVEPIGGWLDCAVYLSVVDNVTGDATFLGGQLIDPTDAAACDGSKGTPAAADRPPRNLARLLELFLGAVGG